MTGSTIRCAAAPGGRSNIEEHARRDALNREIGELEIRASEALREQDTQSSLAQQRIAEDGMEKAGRRAREMEHAGALKLQIEAKEQRRRADASLAEREALEVGSTASLSTPAGMGSGVDSRTAARPPSFKHQLAREVAGRVQSGGYASFGLGADSDAGASSAQSKSEMRQALQAQMQAKQAHKQALREFEQRMEVSDLDAGLQEEASQKHSEQAARAREKELLAEAWREQNKLKGIRSAIEAIELGKRAPSMKTPRGHDAGDRATTASSAGPESWPGSSAGRPASDSSGGRGGKFCSTPRSARGAPLGAAASLTLRGAAAIDCA